MLPHNLITFVLVSVFTTCVTAGPLNRSQSGPTAQTEYGEVKGRRVDMEEGKAINVFLGVPYAAPPVGQLRFAAPEVPSAWEGTRDALAHGPKCLQNIIPEDPVLEGVPFSEDCLYLDIYTPRTRRVRLRRGRVPTMLYIHGGGYYGGTGAKYNFTNMAARGVTVVTINYRLDVFGFLSTQDEAIPGNFGILDQIMAIRWVTENIAAFGGDPRDITLFGASAGGSSVSILTLSPLSRGTFQKAIMSSGVVSSPFSVTTEDTHSGIVPSEMAHSLGESLQCTLPALGEDFSSILRSCLRALPGETIIEVSRAMQSNLADVQIWQPVQETIFGVLPDTPINLLTRNASDLVPIPTLRGYMKDDSSFTIPDPENDGVTLVEFESILRAHMGYVFGSVGADVMQAVVRQYLPNGGDSYTPFEIRQTLIDAMTDFGIAAPTMQEALLFSPAQVKNETEEAGGSRRLSRNEPPLNETFVFEFAYRPSYNEEPSWYGVSHSSEKGFVLGLPQGPEPFAYPNANQQDKRMADMILTLWTNFAKFGNPTPEPVFDITWPAFNAEVDVESTSSGNTQFYSRSILRIRESPEVVTNPRSANVYFWLETVPALIRGDTQSTQ